MADQTYIDDIQSIRDMEVESKKNLVEKYMDLIADMTLGVDKARVLVRELPDTTPAIPQLRQLINIMDIGFMRQVEALIAQVTLTEPELESEPEPESEPDA